MITIKKYETIAISFFSFVIFLLSNHREDRSILPVLKTKMENPHHCFVDADSLLFTLHLLIN